MANGGRSVAACVPSHRSVRRRETEERERVDSISSLPDEILQHIFCLIPTRSAVRTSLLSRRWRHVWCDAPSISFESSTLLSASRMKTQNRYTAPKMMSLHIKTGTRENVKHVNTWIALAISRGVENMSLELRFRSSCYTFPDFFYINFSVKELRVNYTAMIPRCSVSWTSLKKLSFCSCKLSDNSMATILSGCPILEFLKLGFCEDLRVLDLRNSLRLRTLQVLCSLWPTQQQMQIVAPHVRCLKLTDSLLLCTLVDLSSLAEAKLYVCFQPSQNIKPDSLKVMVLKMPEMLEKLRNVEKLSFGRIFLQLWSLPEILSVPFPMFKIKALTLETQFGEDVDVIPPALEKLFQHSPDLKKLTLHTRTYTGRCKKSRMEEELKHVATGVDSLLKETKSLEKMVLQLDDRYFKARGFKEMVQTLSRNYNNISIVLSTKKDTFEEF